MDGFVRAFYKSGEVSRCLPKQERYNKTKRTEICHDSVDTRGISSIQEKEPIQEDRDHKLL